MTRPFRGDTSSLFYWYQISLPVIGCRSQPPQTLNSGHYAAVYNDELWVFPGMRNVEMQRAFRLNLINFTWSDRWMHGEVPTRNMHRRNSAEAIVDGSRLILVGKGPLFGSLL